jgi:hypothetical protein
MRCAELQHQSVVCFALHCVQCCVVWSAQFCGVLKLAVAAFLQALVLEALIQHLRSHYDATSWQFHAALFGMYCRMAAA